MEKNMNEEKVTLSLETVNNILSYLGIKPYQEVFPLINTIRQEAEKSLQPISSENENEKE
jgi:hypothetical protein